MSETIEGGLVDAASDQSPKAAVRPKLFKTIFEYVVLIAIALVLSFGIRSTIAEVRVVPTGSMIPTIMPPYDRLFTLKLLYRFTDPHRGDVVVFDPPVSLKGDYPDPFVKRLIGMPGDTVEVKGGKTFVNGRAYYVSAADTPRYDYGPVRIPARGDTIQVNDGRVYINGKATKMPLQAIPASAYADALRGETVKLDEDYYFMLGDNRNQSYDSHEWGFVPRKNIIARAVCVFWPPKDAKVLN